MKQSRLFDSKSWKLSHDIGYWVLLLLACAVFFAMNVLTTLKEDDLAYSLIEGEWTHMQSLADFFRSHYCHYLTVNGRTSDIVSQICCGLLGKPVFNVLNTLMFGLLLHVLSLLSTGRRSIMVVAMFLAFFGCCFPIPGETMLWLSGSCNYMWAVTLSLLLVYYLLHHRSDSLGWVKSFLLMLFAVVAGSFNEATSLGFFAGLFLYYLFNRDKLDRAVLLVLTGYLLGIMIIAVCPATWNRATSGYIVVDLGWKELLASRWYIFHEKVWRFYTPVAAIVVGLVALFWKGSKSLKRSPWTYIFLCLLAFLFILGIVQERPYTALATVGFLVLAIGVDTLLERWPWARAAVAVVGLALFAYTSNYALQALRAYKAYDDQVVEEIVSSPSQAVLRERKFKIYSRFIRPMKYESTDFFDRELVYRGYYGKENVQFVSDSVYSRYHSGRLLDGAVAVPVKTTRTDVMGEVLAFRDQDYMAVLLRTDTMPLTPQVARYYLSSPDDALAPEELARRQQYGLVTDYTPWGFYPLEYQGQRLLIFPLVDATVSHVAFPISYDPSQEDIVFFPLR